MISINQVTSLYPGTDNGLKNFSCTFAPGIYALLGKNGSGKTTLFRHLMGALFPRQGSLQILGESPKNRNPDILKEIFLIPEEPFFPDTPSTNYVQGMSPFYPNFDKGILQDLLTRWEVPQNTGFRQMSQGQKKKFLIAFALATRAKIMLFDEPTNGLDIVSKLSFKNLGSKMFHPEQLFIFATHQIKDVDTLINHITLIDEGGCWGNYSLDTLKRNFITQVSSRMENSLFSLPSRGGYLNLKKIKESKGSSRGKSGGKKELDLEIFFTAFLQDPIKFGSLIDNA